MLLFSFLPVITNNYLFVHAFNHLIEQLQKPQHFVLVVRLVYLEYVALVVLFLSHLYLFRYVWAYWLTIYDEDFSHPNHKTVRNLLLFLLLLAGLRLFYRLV